MHGGKKPLRYLKCGKCGGKDFHYDGYKYKCNQCGLVTQG